MDTFAAATAYWDTAEARDWNGFAALIADDVVYECPQTRERIRGLEAYARFNREFPGDWHLTIDRIAAAADSAVTRTTFVVDGETMTGIAFLTFDADGKIVKIEDFWPEPYEVPANRAHLSEKY